MSLIGVFSGARKLIILNYMDNSVVVVVVFFFLLTVKGTLLFDLD